MFHSISEYFPLYEVMCTYPELPWSFWFIFLLWFFALVALTGEILSVWAEFPCEEEKQMEIFQGLVTELPGRRLNVFWFYARQLSSTFSSLSLLQHSQLYSKRTMDMKLARLTTLRFFWLPHLFYFCTRRRTPSTCYPHPLPFLLTGQLSRGSLDSLRQ